MTAWGNIDLAVESMKRGARDFIQKRWENERLLSLVRVPAELYQALRRTRQLEMENRLLRGEGLPAFVAGAASMRPVLELIAQVGPSDAKVLITGKHGTGKEIVAKLLHAASLRSRMLLVTVNAGGLPEGTFESEIFGHVKGAFTDARTDRVGRFELLPIRADLHPQLALRIDAVAGTYPAMPRSTPAQNACRVNPLASYSTTSCFASSRLTRRRGRNNPTPTSLMPADHHKPKSTNRCDALTDTLKRIFNFCPPTAHGFEPASHSSS